MKCPHCNGNIDVRFVKAPPDAQASTAASGPVDADEIKELLDGILESSLDERAAEFVSSTRERLEKYGSRIKMSDKQMAWLRKLASSETF